VIGVAVLQCENTRLTLLGLYSRGGEKGVNQTVVQSGNNGEVVNALRCTTLYSACALLAQENVVNVGLVLDARKFNEINQ
jgi:putative lipase involved disintegration of autophagic bodies